MRTATLSLSCGNYLFLRIQYLISSAAQGGSLKIKINSILLVPDLNFTYILLAHISEKFSITGSYLLGV